jgi:UDP-glucose 4-epimerase
MARVVLVTGVSRYLGGLFARILQAEPTVERVIGVDVVPPAQDLGRAEFVRADIRSPVIARVISTAEVDTVVHMNVIATPSGSAGRVSMKEINVIGTMQLLAACQKAPGLRKFVVKSSTAVYGSSACDPAMFTEETEPRRLPRSGFAKDAVEVEGYVRGFSRRRPDVDVTMLRLANVVGPGVHTPLTAHFSLPVIPTVLGFDPRLQLLHEDDAVEALRRVTVDDVPGTFNVAGDGVLLVSQAVRKLGKPALAMPAAVSTWFGPALRRAGLADISAEQMRLLSHGRVVDTTRMREHVGVTPRYSTVEAFDDFARARGLVGVSPETVAAAEQRLVALLTRGTLVDA